MTPPNASSRKRRGGIGWIAAVVVAALVAASFVLPGVFDKGSNATEAAHARAMGVSQGAGLKAGTAVPSFSETDLESGQPITSKTVYNHKTLLFFSEGVMCQACFEQIKGLEQFGANLHKRGIQLVSITPDAPSDLKQAVSTYDITTPVISDEDRTISAAFNTLGQGMHGDTPGHAFALIYRGKVLWYRDYWLAPYRVMYVPPAKLLKQIPTA